MRRGILFIISAPSGTGKTTVLKRVMAETDGLEFSVSHTTRAPRQGEQDGREYFFVSRDQFIAMRERDEFLEWAEVHGNLYGTSRLAVDQYLAQGVDLILDIDVQGARQIRNRVQGETEVFVFLVPPSLEELERRLRSRATDSSEVIDLRCRNARREINEAVHYDYVVVNDALDTAVTMLRSIIIAERSRGRRTIAGKPLAMDFIRFDEDPR